MRRAALLVAACVAFGSAAVPPSLARFTAASAGDALLATTGLVPPASLAAAGGSLATLTWIPTVSTRAQGYRVLRSATAGSSYLEVGTVTPVTVATTTDSPGNGTWYYVLTTYMNGWTSAASNEASAVVVTGSTGFRPCSANAADTGGDNDGYESNPGGACALDGVVAVDANTGTNLASSCANAGKDRHRFWGYAFGLPPTVTAIDGITVRATVGMNNNGGTTVLCAQLSWDGGTTWTATRQVGLTSTALTGYALGGVADTWGRAWLPAELDPAVFRIRVIDASTQPNKSFLLDDLAIEVRYTP